jgi:hypothetical protein
VVWFSPDPPALKVMGNSDALPHWKAAAAADLGGGYKDPVYVETPTYFQGPYIGAVLGAASAGVGIRDAAKDNPAAPHASA